MASIQVLIGVSRDHGGGMRCLASVTRRARGRGARCKLRTARPCACLPIDPSELEEFVEDLLEVVERSEVSRVIRQVGGGSRHVRRQPLPVCIRHCRVLPTGPDGGRRRDAGDVEPLRRRESQPVVAHTDHSLHTGPMHRLGEPSSQPFREGHVVRGSQKLT